MALRPHLTMDLAFSGSGFELPTGKLCLLGAGHIQFERVFHGLTSDLRLNDWWEYLLVAQETTKNDLCQEKSAFGNLIRVDDFGFGKGQDFVIFVSTSDLRVLAFSQHSTPTKSVQGYQINASLFPKKLRNDNEIAALRRRSKLPISPTLP